MDLIFNRDTFHCKLRTSARTVNTAKKAKLYLFLDASCVQSLEICNNDKEVIPSSVASTFVRQACTTSSDDIVGIHFVLKGHAPLIVPDLLLQKRASSTIGIEALLQVGQCKTFTVYLSSSAINREHLLALCGALVNGALKATPEGVINNLYATTNSKIVTHLDELWGPNEPEFPPPYDPPMALRASEDESTGRSDFEPSSPLRARKKRRISFPEARHTPSKRQLSTDKSLPEPWVLATAALGTEVAALRAELSALREEQQVWRVPVIDLENKPRSPPDPVPYCVSPTYYVPHSQTSTVEDTIEDRLMLEEYVTDEKQGQRA
ncbi:hypothetical protein D6D24_10784, partial [Aureobasidium pullulans]